MTARNVAVPQKWGPASELLLDYYDLQVTGKSGEGPTDLRFVSASLSSLPHALLSGGI